MPAVDMPLEKLKSYRGTNQKPADFEEFWKERIKEVNEIGIDYRVSEGEIKGFESCKFYNLWFKGVDGEEIYAKYLRPNTEKEVPLILQFHGYPGASRGWFEQLSFVGMGFAIIAMDCPGQGGNSKVTSKALGTTVSGHIVWGLDDVPENMYYVKLFQNTSVLVRVVEKLEGIDKKRIYANGASQGAGIALATTALNPSIKRCAALYPFLSDYKRVWDMDLDLVAYEGLRYYCRWFDSAGENSEEVFLKLGYIDVHNFANMIKAEVLFGTGLIDSVCPPSTQFAVYNNLETKKRHMIFPDYQHEEIREFDNLLIDFFLKEES